MKMLTPNTMNLRMPAATTSRRTGGLHTVAPPPRPPPASAITCTRAKGAVMEPHIGGLMYDGSINEPWCGGTNLVKKAVPTHLGQHRPFKYGSSKALMEEIRKGTVDKMGTNKEGHDCNFPLWMDMQEDALIKLGLDTMFLMPNSNWTEEECIFSNYELKWVHYKGWVEQLKAGVIKGNSLMGPIQLPVCGYDLQNLEWSGAFILASLTDQFHLEILQTCGINASGPEIMCTIVRKKMNVMRTIQRDYTNKLRKLHISQVSGEHVPTLNNKIKECCTVICRLENAPKDLSIIVLMCFLNATVQIFAQEIHRLYIQLETDVIQMTWLDVLEKTDTYYSLFSSFWTPTAIKPISTNDGFANLTKAQCTMVNKLITKIKAGGTITNGTLTQGKISCWDCGKNDVKKGHPGCATPGTNKFRPMQKPKATTAAPAVNTAMTTTNTRPVRVTPACANGHMHVNAQMHAHMHR